MNEKRAIVIVLDGCGAGEAPDAAAFGDTDSPSTLKHVWDAVGGFSAPTLQQVGLLAAGGIGTCTTGRYGRLRELSQGKDSVTGHWEMMGIVTETPFPTYPDGFPIALVKEFENQIGTQTIGNCAASGTEIIKRLGELHCDSGFPIIYTSADSVFQIACHEDVVPIDKLYKYCDVARRLCVQPNNVQRVIARPFKGEVGSFVRTENRKDFPLVAPPNLIDEFGDVYGIGPVPDLFGGRGFRTMSRTQNNAEHEIRLWEALDSDAQFIFANFEDFDMLFGHRNDPQGFAGALERFDQTLAELLKRIRPTDLVILTADHGNDPTTVTTDHSREFVPVVLIGSGVLASNLGDVEGMTAIGATVAKHLDRTWTPGQSLI